MTEGFNTVKKKKKKPTGKTYIFLERMMHLYSFIDTVSMITVSNM